MVNHPPAANQQPATSNCPHSPTPAPLGREKPPARAHQAGGPGWHRWTVVVLFAVAMAWVEAAAVLYLRTIVGRIDPFQRTPLPASSGLGPVEVLREAATMIMLFTVGWLAGRTWRSRLAYALLAFGVWDIFYYLFLAPISGWPRSLLDWDVLFLIPLPWWGPVISPMLIAALMIAGGTLVSQYDLPGQPLWPSRLTFAANVTGVCLALYVFMADALRVAHSGADALRNLLPENFNWPLFALALALMAMPIPDLVRQVRRQARWNPLKNTAASASPPHP